MGFQMQPYTLLLCLSLGALLKCAAGSDWCYTGCAHSPSHWGQLSGSSCEEKRQSPVNIVTHFVETDQNLGNFTFVNFNSQHVIKSIINNGHTVKFKLAENEVEVSGGGLNGTYSSIQFHFHWGDTEHHPGSEHEIDGQRYPMEMHIVSLKKGLTVDEALMDPEGIAALGFFLNATEDGNVSGPWNMLTSHLTNITHNEVNISQAISIKDLIGNIDLTKFYRYMGSLTTPNCSEAVVWTVFQEPIIIHKNLIEQFPMKAGFTNVYRPVKELNGRRVYASPATPLPPSPPWCYDGHADNSCVKPSEWSLLRYSHCGGTRQSPINIRTENAEVDSHLNAFNFKMFDDKHIIDHVINTGHTVKCVLKTGMAEVSGGGLGHVYSTLQFHFHWGSTSLDTYGSEHTVDSKKYHMEMHIVNKRKDLDLNEAVKTPNGLAVLGFFIEAEEGTRSSGGSDHHETTTASTTSDMGAWQKLTSYFSSIQNISSQAAVTKEISINDLLGSVNRASYYRYNGSLTTPSCNEAVVWTVFKEPIKVDKNLVMMFPAKTEYHDVFRPTQLLHSRKVYTTASASRASAPFSLFLLVAWLCATDLAN